MTNWKNSKGEKPFRRNRSEKPAISAAGLFPRLAPLRNRLRADKRKEKKREENAKRGEKEGGGGDGKGGGGGGPFGVEGEEGIT